MRLAPGYYSPYINLSPKPSCDSPSCGRPLTKTLMYEAVVLCRVMLGLIEQALDLLVYLIPHVDALLRAVVRFARDRVLV
jgi:hypothetical protein